MSLLELLGLRQPLAQAISPKEAHEMQQNGEIIIIDVRQPDEWQKNGMPKGAYGVGLSSTDFIGAVEKIAAQHKGCRLALTCQSGMRTKAAIKTLDSHGMKDLYQIKGGLMAWNRQGLPLK